MNNEQAGVIIRDIFARVQLETGESERELLSANAFAGDCAVFRDFRE